MVINKFNNIIHIIIIIFLLLFSIKYFTNSLSENTNITTRNYNYQSEGWSNDIRISDKNNDYWCTFSHIVANGQYVHVVWDENLNSSNIGGHGLCYRRSQNAGNTWSDITYLSYPNSSFLNAITAFGSNVHVIFTSELVEGIIYRKSTDNGTGWGPIVTNLTEYRGGSLNIDASEKNVHICFSYRDEKEEIWGIVYLRSTNNGNTWDKPIFIMKGRGITNYLRPQLKISNNNIYIVYWGVNDTVELLSSYDNGDTWENKILFNGPDVGYPVIAAENKHVGIVWVNKSLDNFQLEFIKSDDFGKTWTDPIIINDLSEKVDAYEPSLFIEKDAYHLVWSDFRDSSIRSRKIFTEIYYKTSTNAGDYWTKDIRLTQHQEDCDNPVIVAYGNNVYVIWEDEREDGQQVFFKRTLPDFIIDNFQDPGEVWANVNMDLNFFMRNIGYADGYNVSFIVKDNGQVIYEGIVNEIKVNKVRSFSVPWTPLESGIHKLEFIVDSENKLEEWNETNNIFRVNITVNENEAPIAEFELNKLTSKTFEDISFDASGSHDPDGTIEAYYFDFGDGNNSGWVNNSKLIYDYSQPGDYNCFVIVQDDYGAENNNNVEQMIIIEWNEQPPVINDVVYHPLYPVCNENITIFVDAYDLNMDTLEYIYDPEDGRIFGSGNNITWQAPEKEARYTIKIRVFDGTFNSSIWTLKIWVRENQPPRIQNISYTPNEILPLESINITVNASDLNGHSIQYNFISNGGTLIQNGSFVTWEAPDEDGIYIITINVSDAYGGYDQEKIFILVGEPKPDSLIKSFKTTPAKIYKDEKNEILIELEIDRDYTDFIDEANINLSTLTGNPAEPLLDSGINGDVARDDGIYSYRLLLKINNYTGEYQLWANVKTTIPCFELNTSTVLEIGDKPVNDTGSVIGIYIGTTIVLILIIVLILFLWIKKKNK